MKKLGDEVGSLVRKVIGRHQPAMAELVLNWPKIVGIKYAALAQPVKLTSFKEKSKFNKLLTIRAENSATALELNFQQMIMIERIAIYLGYKAVDKIKVII